MADIDKKYASVVNTVEFENWVKLLHKELPNYLLDTVSTRILLFYYLFYRENYEDMNTLRINPDFIDLIDRGFFDILDGEHVMLEHYTIKFGDYAALLRNYLKTIYVDSLESLDNVADSAALLPNLESIYVLENINEHPNVPQANLGLLRPSSVGFPESWANDISIRKVTIV